MYHNLPDGALASSQTPFFKTDSLDSYVKQTRPGFPVSVLRPDRLKARAQEVVAAFPGTVMYAMKCNPSETVLRAFIDGGIASFDCASINEIRQIRALKPDATTYFMHPIKAREAIREAYFGHGVRAFVLDSADELKKIREETKNAKDLTLFIRMAMPKQNVLTDFSVKFGASPLLTSELLKQASKTAALLGLAFHVGTHCLDTSSYARATQLAGDVVKAAGVTIDLLDIGGGFPATLDANSQPPVISAYFAAVADTLETAGLSGVQLLCEPGRGLVADGGELVVRVEGRKGDLLFINDGTYGGLLEGGPVFGLPYPVRMIRAKGVKSTSSLASFRFAGPTCDSTDMFQGPFMLPGDIREGDYIVIGQIGAYGEASRTVFNGFSDIIYIELTEKKAKAKQAKAA